MVEGGGGSWGGLGEGGSLSVGLRGYVAALVRPQKNGFMLIKDLVVWN